MESNQDSCPYPHLTIGPEDEGAQVARMVVAVAVVAQMAAVVEQLLDSIRAPQLR